MKPPSLARLDRLVPPALRHAEPAVLRRARLIVLFSLLLSGMSLAFTPLVLAQGRTDLAVDTLIAAVVDLSPILVLWGTRSIGLAGTLPGVLGTVALGGFSLLSGGVHGATLYWYPVLIAVAMVLAGRRGALGVVATQLVLLAALVGVDLLGVPLPPSEAPTVFGAAFSVAVLSAGTYGLISLLERANEEMRRALVHQSDELRYVLDNVGQGFLCADREGRLVGDRSAVTERWFGRPARDARLWSWLGADDGAFAVSAELGWSALWEDVLPIELCLDQLPGRIERGDRTFRVDYRPVLGGDGVIERVVVVVSDVTELLETERAEARQREVAGALDRALRDRAGFLQFVEEVDAMLGRLASARGDTRRLLHTLKGNCGVFGVNSVAERCHALETRLVEHGEDPDADAVAGLRACWADFRVRVASVTGERTNVIELDRFRYRALRDATRERAPYEQLDRLVDALVHEPAALPLARAAEHARQLAVRLGKPAPRIDVDDGGLLLDPVAWRDFWAAFVHPVRNAVDHGLEEADHRVLAGKPAAGALRLRAVRAGDRVLVELADDGGGVDWDRVAARARALGLGHTDLAEALFAEGLTTLDAATDTSGRGIGMGAFREAARALGGEVEVRSERGAGTTIRVSLPGGAALDAACAEVREVG